MTHLRATADELALLTEQYRIIAGVLSRYEFTYPITQEDVDVVWDELNNAVYMFLLEPEATLRWRSRGARFRVRDADGRIIYDRTMVAAGSPE